MTPPQWAIRTGRPLTLDEFGQEFAAAWSRIGRRFLKVECWQTYQELDGTRSQEAYRRGDVERALELLEQEAEADRPLYEDVRIRGLEYCRIRLVQEPLTPYLDYELLAYRIRAKLGEIIEIVRCAMTSSLPNDEFFDFLLFDRRTALIHDYGDTGRQAGGWLIDDPAVLQALEDRAVELRRTAVPLAEFMAVT
ncbi:hypothetical protein Sru01_07100 [Sphaerisporangium rufum]|uniref:DUF6879 domain-containing protein n=1 Tax=Sphaerisporangium rufum TaxID=1381558 RepID=A0A919QYN9_9ACTN|nr:DUF6879 family protein [Sphaerisporangium rufum]GII75728.1 hypothetical protein Sru01_07100 [Sphaerisporangium rufum]